MVDILNRGEGIHFNLSPVYLALAGFCFSMTIGVFWEFFEFSMDRIFYLDMQKDTVIHRFQSVMLDESMKNIPILVDGITSTAVNGVDLGVDGFLDIGLFDTMEDLFVNFIGALVFSIIVLLSNKFEKARWLAFQFIPRVEPKTETKISPAEEIPKTK